MRFLMIGDIVGKPGRKAIHESLPSLRRELNIDFVIANGENAAGGNGITKAVANELLEQGIDVLTMGNHVWDKKEIFEFIDQEDRIIRPANYPEGTPGQGFKIFPTAKGNVAVISLSGRIFMGELDCPFRRMDQIIKEIESEAKMIFVDFHAEATSEKVAMGWYLDGKVSGVCGTHTHIQTADERILPNGTAYITDLGMTGPRDSVLGVKKEIIIKKFLTQLPTKFEVATGGYQLNAAVIEVEENTGKAIDISLVQNFEI